MHSDVKKCADGGDIKGLKYIFVDCLDVDPTFEKYAEDFAYCRNLPGFLETHKELTPVRRDQKDWDENYWGKLKSDLLKNFSLSRFTHMQEVAKVIYADKVIRLKNERSQAAQNRSGQEKQGKNEAGPADLGRQGAFANAKTQEAPAGMTGRAGASRTRNAGISKSEQQRQELEKKRKALAEENSLQEEKLRQERQSRTRNTLPSDSQAAQPEGTDSKKLLGIVLIAAVIMVIVLIILIIR